MLRAWVVGLWASLVALVTPREGPKGHFAGMLSPLLETLRVEAVAKWVQGPRVLDCGCGHARLVDRLPPATTYVGIDHDSEMIRYVREKYPQAQFAESDITDPPPGDEPFDTIVMAALLEHVADQGQLVRHWAAYLTPGGRLIVTTPVPRSDGLLRIGSRLGIFSKEAHADHETYADRASLHRLMADGGLQTIVYRRFALGFNQILVATKAWSLSD